MKGGIQIVERMIPIRRGLIFTRPDEQCINSLANLHRQSALTYSQIGWTRRGECPGGFAKIQSAAVVGHGEQAFRRAKAAVQNYDMLRLGWMEPIVADIPLVDGSIVCTLSRKLMMYSVNVNRVIYVDDRSSKRFGFGFGTTAHHLLIGEERFTVCLDESNGDVTYEIFSYSRPGLPFFRAALPWLRHLQRVFCHASTLVMHAACKHGSTPG